MEYARVFGNGKMVATYSREDDIWKETSVDANIEDILITDNGRVFFAILQFLDASKREIGHIFLRDQIEHYIGTVNGDILCRWCPIKGLELKKNA